MIGGYVTAKKLENMVREITMRGFLYNLLIRTTKTAQEKDVSKGRHGTEGIIKY